MTTTGAAPSSGLRLSRSRGASGWRLRIYDALWEADQEGRTLTYRELVDECVVRFNKSGTMQWAQTAKMIRNKRTIRVSSLPYEEIVAYKMHRTLMAMRAKKPEPEVRNLGGIAPRSTSNPPRYTIGVPPKYWHPRTYRPGHFKEYLPARADPEARKAARRMDSGWFAEVRMELAKPKPRGDRMKELLSEGLDIFGA